MVLIDSDIMIWLLRGREDIKEKFETLVKHYKGRIFITPIQIAEIYAGMREKERVDTELFLNTFIPLTITEKIGQLAGEYMNQYNKSHSVLLADSLIAATAKKFNLKIWILNRKHYPMLVEKDFV